MVQPFLPNEADAFNANQAEPDSVDFEILLLGYQRTGVVSGCAVTESSPAAQTVDVAVGEVVETGEQISVSAQADVAVSAADGSNPRFDLITINGSGTVVVTAGTAAAQPVLPAIPASSVPLAALYIPTSDNTHADNQIVDKRVIVADRYVFNVMDFGAVADGATDDSAAIQAAIDAAEVAGGTVFLPDGTYRITAALTLTAPDVVLRGQSMHGAIIKLGNTVDLNGINLNHAADRCIIENLTFDGNKANNTSGIGVQTNAVTATTTLDDVVIRHCWFKDWSEYGIRGNGAGTDLAINNLLIEANTFEGTEDHAIFLNWTCPEARIINNKIKNTSSVNANGIWIGNGSDRSLIANNHVADVSGFGIEVFDAERINIEGNVVSNAADKGISCDKNHHGVVSGNVIEASAGDGIENAGSVPLTITGNSIIGGLRPVSASQSGQVSVIVGNTFKDCTQGLQILNAGPGSIVGDNHFDNVGSGGAVPNGRTIFINTSPYTRVRGNTIVTVTGDAAKDFPIYFTVSDPAFCDSNFISDPDGVYTNTTLAPGADTTLHGNYGRVGSNLERLSHDGVADLSANTTLGWVFGIINMDTAGGARVITLPLAAAVKGKSYLIRRDGANTVTIDRAGSDTFDDADIQKTLDSDGAAIGIFSIGDGEWKIVGTEGTVGGS